MTDIERDPIAYVEQTLTMLRRVVAHRNAYLLGAVGSADAGRHDDAHKSMRCANEFDRMADVLLRAIDESDGQ